MDTFSGQDRDIVLYFLSISAGNYGVSINVVIIKRLMDFCVGAGIWLVGLYYVVLNLLLVFKHVVLCLALSKKTPSPGPSDIINDILYSE